MLYLTFLWHMHQPYYKDPLTGEYSMPWVRLHAIKDYLDMVEILRNFSSLHQTFNLVPSLLDQLEDYAREGSDIKDKFFVLSKKPAAELTDQEKDFILYYFFFANEENMIRPWPRYYDLLMKRGKYAAQGEISEKGIRKRFTASDFLDLQVLFNLAWFDPLHIKNDGALKGLADKGKYFTEGDKNLLLEKQINLIKKVIPAYRELQDKGQIEVSTSPYYHPILPLLCDTNIARQSQPSISLPKAAFGHPEDASAQVGLAVEKYKSLFGRPPAGLWPSEGSVSENILPLVASQGIRWLATDEEILLKSLKAPRVANIIYKPYLLKRGDTSLSILFRDHNLSDLIGFVYYRMNYKDAAAHFLKQLHNIHDAMVRSKEEGWVVPIILDGENVWEYYPNDGNDFLRELYEALSRQESIKVLGVSEYLKLWPAKDEIAELYPGSWINGNFKIWIGHNEKNKAWDYLGLAREELVKAKGAAVDKEKLGLAWRELYIAEGSDWNWWYGDDHSSGQDDEFDRLFRLHIANIYKLLNIGVPEYLAEPIKSKFEHPEVEPAGLIHPVIDGIDTNYYEWLKAGYIDASRSGGAMHQAKNIVSRFWYGFDERNLFARFDLTAQNSTFPEPFSISMKFPSCEARIDISFASGTCGCNAQLFGINGNEKRPIKILKEISCAKIVEISIPLEDLNIKPGESLSISIAVERQGMTLERLPKAGSILIQIPKEDFEASQWSA